jgi:hypothetical protein
MQHTYGIGRREWLGLVSSLGCDLACEALGMKANINTSTTVNGKTTAHHYEAKNLQEFQQVMGEVATDFSSFAKEVGATTAELAKKLVEVPPQGQVRLRTLVPSLAQYDGDIRYDYIAVALTKPEPQYDFKYVQLGIPQFDSFFRSSAETYAATYQLVETGRHIYLADVALGQGRADASIKSGNKRVTKTQVEGALTNLDGAAQGEAIEIRTQYHALWEGMATLGAELAAKAGETAQAGAALVASAPAQITNPKLLLHLDLIVKGLGQSVDLLKDSASLISSVLT